MSQLFKFFGFDRVWKIRQMVQQNGGIKKSFLKIFRNDTLKSGRLVGTDKYGNHYYENPYYFYGTNRWVEYADHVHLNYDASMIPAEWFGWLHYKTDLPPGQDCSRPKYKWMSDHSINHSGTKESYMPYTTVRPKISIWNPSKKIESNKCR